MKTLQIYNFYGYHKYKYPCGCGILPTRPPGSARSRGTPCLFQQSVRIPCSQKKNSSFSKTLSFSAVQELICDESAVSAHTQHTRQRTPAHVLVYRIYKPILILYIPALGHKYIFMNTTSINNTGNSWTLIFIFGRNYKETHTGLTAEQAQQMIAQVVFRNQDCVNFFCFRS